MPFSNDSRALGKTPSGPSDESITFVFEMGLKKISDQTAVCDALDSKIGLLLGFVVVSVAEVLGFLLLAAADNTNPSPRYTPPVLGLFLLSFFLVLGATVAGLLGLGMRKFALGFRYHEMVSKANHSPQELRIMFLDDLLQSSKNNSSALDQKQKWARITLILVVLTLLTYAALSILLFTSLMPKGVCYGG
jgi:hypothetical protein